jgi:hypothetical protein
LKRFFGFKQFDHVGIGVNASVDESDNLTHFQFCDPTVHVFLQVSDIKIMTFVMHVQLVDIGCHLGVVVLLLELLHL